MEAFDALIGKIMKKRGLSAYPSLAEMAPLSSWPGLVPTAYALADAVEGDERIGIWGDYDVDGVTSTATALLFFEAVREMNGLAPRLSWHIPNRFVEGYGLNETGIEEMAKDSVRTLLTVDCGIASVKAVERAKEFGMRVIVTDHHLPDGGLPGCIVCDPSLRKNAHAEGLMLAGVGTVFMVLVACAQLLARRGRKVPDMRRWLDLVALGTVADVADLGGQNRILVSNGLVRLSKGYRPGIRALKIISGIPPEGEVRSMDIAFSLAPRLNAAGRMARADIALALLLAKHEEKAMDLARELDRLNRLRKDEEERIAKEAIAQGEEQIKQGARAVLAFSPDWHEGVVGIAASRVTECLGVPSLVCCEPAPGRCKGSGRSVEGVDLHGILSACAAEMEGFGGHAMAAGVRFRKEKLGSLRKAFAANCPGDALVGIAERQEDAVFPVEALELHDLSAMDRLEPTGAGNPPLLLKAGPYTLYDFEIRGGLLVMTLCHDDSGRMLRARRWRPKTLPENSDIGRAVTVWCTPEMSMFGGAANLELNLDHWMFS